DGIVPAFAMKAAGAIRQNSGRIVSRFGKNLDAAYLSHRVLLPEPEDAEVFMLENFVSYMRNILAIGRVDNLTLGDKPIESWIRQNEALLSRTIVNGDAEYKLELEDTIELSKNGFHNNLHQILESKKSKMARPYKDASKEASLKAISIFDSESITAVDSSMELSILSVFRRTYKDVVDIHEIPYLTQGTIIYSKVKDQFLLCITPKCDTVRIDFSKKFSFAILDEVDGKSFDMVIPLNPFVEQHKKEICEIKKDEVILSIMDDMILHDGKINDKTLNDTLKRLLSANYGDYIHLSTSPKFYTLEHIIFESDEKGRVPSSKICDDLIEFWDQDFNEYIWIGDLHDLNTISRVANLITNLNRTGNDEVEWLRRQYQ
ncbi:MAG: hypothetical protein HRT68_15870, partial [Flavobacteriaceae bacterium]|nr:hypothetical protein [Flavobacteriaceae bacterium]